MLVNLRPKAKRIASTLVAFKLVSGMIITAMVPVFLLAQPVAAQGGCPGANYFPETTTIIQNGDFSIQPNDTFPNGANAPLGYDSTTYYDYNDAHFTSQTANVGAFTYPADIIPYRNQFSIQNGHFQLGELDQLPFPGDLAFGVPITNYWYYSNGNALGPVVGANEYINWEQDVSGLKPNTDYVFVAYISNVIEPPQDSSDDPTMSLRIGGTHGQPDGARYLSDMVLTEAATSNSSYLNGWQRVAATFNTGTTGTSPFLKITDNSTGINGDDFAMTAISLQECKPLGHDWTPIMRAYGNDVIAGGGYTDDVGNVCKPSGPVSVSLPPFVHGLGKYNPSDPKNHSTYVGSGAELGVFAAGDIKGFLPGAGTNVPRSQPWELSFANTVSGGPLIDTSAATMQFGGGFANQICPHYPTPAGASPLPAGALNLNSITTSGDYILPIGTQKVFGQVRNGLRLRLFAQSDLFISNDISYAGANGGWATTDDIPRLELYVDGDVTISEDVNEISGIIRAKGNLYTCVAQIGTILLPGKSPDNSSPSPVGDHEDYITTRCQNKLTVYGSITAERTYAYRVRKEGIQTGQPAEKYDSDNLSEAFVFSPETYLSYINGSPSSTVSTRKFDALITLPPTY